MKNIFRVLFESVKVGEEWREYNEDPFSYKPAVKVLEIKEGWVKYEYCLSGNTETLSLLDFKAGFSR